MKKALRSSGLSLMEVIVVIVVLAILGFVASKAQNYTLGTIGRAEFTTVMDQYNMEASIKLQSSDGLTAIKDWINTDHPSLLSCLSRTGTNCETLNNTRIPVQTSVDELKTRRFLKSGSICTAPLCEGETRIWIIPNCAAPNLCSGVNAEVETVAITQNSIAPKKGSFFFSALKLVPTVGFDFSCANTGKLIIGFDLANRKALCATSEIADCAGAVPKQISGLGSLSSVDACKPVLTFASRSKDGFGNNTTLFSPGYKSIGLSQAVNPGTITNALAQEECGTTVLKIVTMTVGDTYNGNGSCPGNSQKTIYKHTHERRYKSSFELVGTRTPHDTNPENMHWGKSKGVHWDVRFDRPNNGYSTIEWHLTDQCCRNRDDVWTLEQMSNRFREETDISAVNNVTLKREYIAIMDTDPIIVKFNIFDQNKNFLMSKSITATEVGKHNLKMPIVASPAAEIVPETTPLGVTSLSSDGTYIYMTKVEAATFDTSNNSVTYTYNLSTRSISNQVFSNETTPKVSVKYVYGSNSSLALESRDVAKPQFLTQIQPKAVAVHSVDLVSPTTPLGTEGYEATSRFVIHSEIQEAIPGNNGSSGPIESRELKFRDSSGNVVKTVTLNVAPNDRVRVKYILNFNWTLTDALSSKVDYQIRSENGTVLRSILVAPNERVKVSYKKSVIIVPR